MKIIIYSHEFTPHTGGIAIYNEELAVGLSERGHDVLVIAPQYHQQEDNDRDEVKPYRIRRPVPETAPRVIRVLFLASSLLIGLLRFRPSKVLVSDGGSQRVTAILSLVFPLDYIMVMHGKEIRRLFDHDRLVIQMLRRVILLGFQRAKAIIAVSNATREIIGSHIPGLLPKTKVIHIGISVEPGQVSECKRDEIRESLSIASADKLLLTVSRLVPNKGHDHVIKALPEILRHQPEVRYLIIGEGPWEDNLKTLAHKTGVEDYVRFVGKVPHRDVWTYYSMCDVFIMPSRRKNENFGIVFLEAAAFAKPAIGGSIGGVMEAVQNGETGILVNPDSVNEIAHAAIHLLTHPEIARKLGKNGKDRYERKFSKETMIDKTIEVLKN